MTDIPTISVSRLAEIRSQHDVDLIDVRTPLEFRDVHADGARNVPLDSLDPHRLMKERVGASDDPVYLICKSGSRAARACQQFVDAGYANVVSVDGGTAAWDDAGLPVKRGKKAMSLERQVRIAAGLIVLIGSLLSLLVHPYFAGIAGFVGGGLMFSGITDSCAMGMLIAKMPWNKVSGDTSCSS